MLARSARIAAQCGRRGVSSSTALLQHSVQGHPRPPSSESAKTSLMFTMADAPGALKAALEVFEKHQVSLSRIESRPSLGSATYDFLVDFDGDCPPGLLEDLGEKGHVGKQRPAVVPWFPSRIQDIDSFSTQTLDAGADLESDHPGFSDHEYRERRKMIVERAATYRHGEPIPRVDYTENEVNTWGAVYDKLIEYHQKYAAKEYLEVIVDMEQHCGYARNNIPQLEDISNFLKSRTGFSLRPVGGLLSARDFLNALAFRVFFSTQYLRHHSRPLYTPEPDIVHELMGHVPMFANPEFAQFSQEIGLASLGASDEEITKLATCYWFSVEFGLCMEDGMKKAYGAGLLSSFGELEYSCSPVRPAGGEENFPRYLHWDPYVAATTEYPITTYQPIYFVASSIADAKERMTEYCANLPRPFGVRYSESTQSVTTDRAIKRSLYET